MKSISIIVPIFYCDPSLFLTIETCFSTLNACYPGIDVIGVDDASPLDCPPHWPIEMENAINQGYVSSVNSGLRASSADIVIVANDDLVFHQGCLDRYFDLPDGVIAGPADTASGDLPTLGAIFGMTRKTLETMGYLDERFRNYCADEEYWERAGRLGIEVRVWDDVRLEHKESATFGLLEKERLLSEDQARRSITR